MALPHVEFEPERKTIMTAKDKIARRKLSLLELAPDLANVSRAGKRWDIRASSSTRSAATSRPTAPRG